MAGAMNGSKLMLALLGCGCGPAVLGDLPGQTEGDAMSADGDELDDNSASASETGADAPPGEWIGVQLTPNKQVDFLFVIDDSRSTGLIQANLAANFPAFIALLEAEDVTADYRIAITTTDLGAPGCDSTPESGAFVASSCIERIADFIGDDGEDVSQSACLDVCDHASIDIRSSETEVDDTSVRRPWIERIGGEANLNGDVTPVEALQCMIPQGIDGCEFIAPLEAARLAIERANTPGEAEYGFLRDDASLNIVVVTDGDDCSVPFEKRAIFLPPEDCYDADGDGDDTDDCTQVYWTDPDAEAATPGVCWNAGIECSGAELQPDGSTTFASCVSVDKGLDGAPASADEAVLYPVQRYVDWLGELDLEKSNRIGRARLYGVAGVPVGSVTIPFATSTDSDINLDQGIGPSCWSVWSAPPGHASPPVRLSEVIASDFDKATLEDVLMSVCASDYSPVFEPLTDAIRTQLKPGCATRCAADLEPSTPALEFDCEVRQTVPAPEPVIDGVPMCLAQDAVPEGADVCWVPLTRTGTPLTEMSEECIDDGWNLEMRIVRRDGHPALSGTLVEIACAWTDPVDGVCLGD
jgi:hypothetical protein